MNLNTVTATVIAGRWAYVVTDSLGRRQGTFSNVHEASADAARRCRFGTPLGYGVLCRTDSECQDEHGHYAAVTGELSALAVG